MLMRTDPFRELDRPAQHVLSANDLEAEVDQLRAALETRTTTGQATGLLASRLGIPTERAWALLRETSNLSHEKLNNLARIVVDTHNQVPFTDDDRQVALALASVFDVATARVLDQAAGASPWASRGRDQA